VYTQSDREVRKRSTQQPLSNNKCTRTKCSLPPRGSCRHTTRCILHATHTVRTHERAVRGSLAAIGRATALPCLIVRWLNAEFSVSFILFADRYTVTQHCICNYTLHMYHVLPSYIPYLVCSMACSISLRHISLSVSRLGACASISLGSGHCHWRGGMEMDACWMTK
jgi:hypothetical protein